MIAPGVVAVVVNVLVTAIIGKTVVPEMLDGSRFLFAWAQDGLLPKAFLHTAPSKAPDVALFTSAALGTLFLLEATFFGWSIGVLLRSLSIVLVFGMLGIGVLNIRFNRSFREVPWARDLLRHKDVLAAAVLAIIIAAVLISSVISVPDQPLALQPSTQAGAALVVAVVIYALAALSARRRGVNLSARARQQLTEE
jgi:amino acid transporter